MCFALICLWWLAYNAQDQGNDTVFGKQTYQQQRQEEKEHTAEAAAVSSAAAPAVARKYQRSGSKNAVESPEPGWDQGPDKRKEIRDNVSSAIVVVVLLTARCAVTKIDRHRPNADLQCAIISVNRGNV